MSGENVLVTGAAGFIGGHVTHRIALGEAATVTPLVHSIGGAGTMRVGRLPVDIEQGSVLDRGRMEELLADCDAVVNCAHGGREVTVDGTRTLLAAAESQGVESYVHLSSAVVHGHDAEGTITEETPLAPDTDYAERKATAEQLVRTWDGDLEPTVFRPCIVYGPHSPWVRKPLRRLREGAVLADGGVGEVNRVYVDNLVDAVLAAVGDPAADGEVFVVADDEPVTWQEYYRRLGRLLDDHPPIQSRSTAELALYRKGRYLRDSVVPPVRLLTGLLTAPETLQRAATELERTPWAPAIYRRLPSDLQDEILDRINAPASATGQDSRSDTSDVKYEYPPPNQAKLQSTRSRISTGKLKATLDWEPRVSFEESMERIAAWAEYEGITDSEYVPTVGNTARSPPGNDEAADPSGDEVAAHD